MSFIKVFKDNDKSPFQYVDVVLTWSLFFKSFSRSVPSRAVVKIVRKSRFLASYMGSREGLRCFDFRVKKLYSLHCL